jgi:hypothetical protein
MPVTDGFRATDAMLAFRKHATITAIIAAASRPKERMKEAWRYDYQPHVTESLLSHWRRLYKDFDWFDGWLLRGEDLPANVRVVTPHQVRRCARAWDYAMFCRLAKTSTDSYVIWLSRGLIPNIAWLKWLFGAPAPAGTFVVGHELQRLRREMSRKGILRAINLNTASIWVWERNPRTTNHIKAILDGRDASKLEGWDQIHVGTRRKMEGVYRVSSLDESCKRAKTSIALYYKAMQEAERYGVKNELLQYLKIEGKYTSNMSRQSGLVAENFFIPSPFMLRFREQAVTEGAKQQIWSLQNLPGFVTWFLDWVTPKPHRGRRHLLPSTVSSINGESGAKDGMSEMGIEKVLSGSQEVVRTRQSQKKRGRQKGWRDEEVANRKQKMLEAWDRGDFGKNKAAAARAYNFHRPDASKWIREHQRSKEEA